MSARVTMPTTLVSASSTTSKQWPWAAINSLRAVAAGVWVGKTSGASGSSASITFKAASRSRRRSSLRSAPSRVVGLTLCQRSTRAALRPAAAINGNTILMSRVSSNNSSRAVKGALTLPASTAAMPTMA